MYYRFRHFSSADILSIFFYYQMSSLRLESKSITGWYVSLVRLETDSTPFYKTSGTFLHIVEMRNNAIIPDNGLG